MQKFAFGFYGKIPSVGDFVHRGLSGASISLIDAWLQAGMDSMDLNSSPHYERYMVSPICCFILPKNVWSHNAVAGFIMPSIDRVGRLFPLVVMLEMSQEEDIDHAILASALAHASADALHALHQRLSPGELYDRLVCSRELTIKAGNSAVFDAGIGDSCSIGGTRSLWWRLSGSEMTEPTVFENSAAEKIFPYLFSG
ncbi:type VI secretion system-associated protein TagF [Halopseudomonas salegens]|uniref:Type VI secretion system protein ImpM n=1 Tax=Halopseudomonas salegens TaxID=1434072 RepID=A0A1H2E1C0_9GAMM|nr:type VI secretion system-associated protein TagF [Halopseudomonas salegens]SDT88518.1 type VI secretion system protein ImpM [Halopseudomonas salegens]